MDESTNEALEEVISLSESDQDSKEVAEKSESDNKSTEATKAKKNKKKRSDMSPDELALVRERDRIRKRELRMFEGLAAVVERCKKIREDKRARRAAMTEAEKEEMRKKDRERKRKKRLEAKLGIVHERPDIEDIESGEIVTMKKRQLTPEELEAERAAENARVREYRRRKREFEMNPFVHGVSEVPVEFFEGIEKKRQERREKKQLKRAAMTDEEREAARQRDRERRKQKKANETEQERERRRSLENERKRTKKLKIASDAEPVEVLLTVPEDELFVPECELRETVDDVVDVLSD